jgi:hypothetical protein
MNKYGIFLIVCLGWLSLIQAQPGRLQDRADRLEAFRIGYFTERMSLTPEEARRFWPVYESYQAEEQTLKMEMQEYQRRMRMGMATMSDKELDVALDKFLDFKQREFNLAAKYKEKFKEVLSIRKVVAYFRAEQEFNRTLLNSYKEKLEDRLNQDR